MKQERLAIALAATVATWLAAPASSQEILTTPHADFRATMTASVDVNEESVKQTKYLTLIKELWFRQTLVIAVEGKISADGKTVTGQGKLALVGGTPAIHRREDKEEGMKSGYPAAATRSDNIENLKLQPTGKEQPMPWIPSYWQSYAFVAFDVSGTLSGKKLTIRPPKTAPSQFVHTTYRGKGTVKEPMTAPFPIEGMLPTIEFDTTKAEREYTSEDWKGWLLRGGKQTQVSFPDPFDPEGALLTRPGKLTFTANFMAKRAAGKLVVKVQHKLIPGTKQIRNRITFTLPTDLAPAKDGWEVVVTKKDFSFGHLLRRESDDLPADFARELRFPGMNPGDTGTLYYAWGAAPPDEVQHETIIARVPAMKLEGSESFEVGMDLRVAKIDRVDKGPLTPGNRHSLAIKVRDRLHPDMPPEKLAEVLRELAIEPVLSFKQKLYTPEHSFKTLAETFDLSPSHIVQAFESSVYDVKGKRPPATIMGDGVAWPVSNEGVLTPGVVVSHPYLVFHARGLHVFHVNIQALRRHGADLPEPLNKPTPIFAGVTEFDEAGKFIHEVMIPSLEKLWSLRDPDTVLDPRFWRDVADWIAASSKNQRKR